jgi:hypothetical protein
MLIRTHRFGPDTDATTFIYRIYGRFIRAKGTRIEYTAYSSSSFRIWRGTAGFSRPNSHRRFGVLRYKLWFPQSLTLPPHQLDPETNQLAFHITDLARTKFEPIRLVLIYSTETIEHASSLTSLD